MPEALDSLSSVASHESPLYPIWSEMVELCLTRACSGCDAVDGHGIELALAWRDFAAFSRWALAHGYRNGKFLLRQDPDGPFAPDNCVWVDSPMQPRGRRLLTAFGETKHLAAWGRDPRCVVDIHTVTVRLREGWDVERALTYSHRVATQDAHRVTAFGEAKTVPEWAQDSRCVVAVVTLETRLWRGWAPERALTTPAGNLALLTAFGETRRVTEWGRDPRCVVPLNVLRGRVFKSWDPETALTHPLDAHAVDVRTLTAFGETKRLSAWMRDPRCVVSRGSVIWRLSQGWSPEDALIRPALDAPANTRLLEAFGERKSVTAWGRDPRCAVNRASLAARLAAGWDLERALTTAPKPGGRGHAAD